MRTIGMLFLLLMLLAGCVMGRAPQAEAEMLEPRACCLSRKAVDPSVDCSHYRPAASGRTGDEFGRGFVGCGACRR